MSWAMATLLPLTLLLLIQPAILFVVHAEPRLSLSSASQFFPALSWPALTSSSNTAFVNKYSLLPDHGLFNLFAPILSSSGFSSSHKGFSLGFLSVFRHTDATASPARIYLAICLGSIQKDVNGQIFAVPVWLANKDTPLIVPKQGKIGLYLNAQKELQLVDGDGDIVWAVRGLVESMELKDNGNLALYNAENETVWQSFDYPGDGLLEGQALPLGKRIASSNALFAGEMRTGGLMFYMQSSLSVPLAYFILALNQTVEDYFSGWINQGSFELSRDLPVNLTAAIYSEVSFTPRCLSDKHVPCAVFEGGNLTLQYADKCPSGFKVSWPSVSYFQNHILGVSYNSDVVRLDADGILRGYTYLNHNGEHFFSSDLVNTTLCIAPNTCGPYGICSHYVQGWSEHICKCPSADENPEFVNAFAPVSSHDFSLGCHRTVPLQCKEGVNQSLVRIKGATFISFRAVFEATLIYNTIPLDTCKRQCESNCSCAGIYYHKSSSFCLPFSDGTPLAKVSLLTLYSEDYATYLKVQFSSYVGNAVSGVGKSGNSSNQLTKRFLPALIVAGLLVVGCIVALFVAHKRTQWRSKRDFLIDEKDPELEHIMPMLPTRFSYKELHSATNGFNKMVGKGGFGSVFEGVLADSRKVAVKRLEMISPQVKPFLAEVATIGSISHYNIARLFGFCSERMNRLLVYEYMENGSLDRWLFCKESNEGSDKEKIAAVRGGMAKSQSDVGFKGKDDSSVKAFCCNRNGGSKEATEEADDDGCNKKKAKMIEKGGDKHNDNGDKKVYTVLSWETRYNVALGTARALAYLHEECRQPIIHFDIKPENILLDADFVPKVSDFGLAKLVDRGASSVYTVVRGTAGYVAPEWLSHSLASKKCDVYSYGMVLLELIGGRRNAEPAYVSTVQWYLPKWAAMCCREGNEWELVDKRLGGCYDAEQVKRLLQVAFLCIHRQPGSRPSMSTVCKLLEGSSTLASGSYNGIGETSQGERPPLSKLFLETLSQYDSMEETSEIASIINSSPSLPYSSIEGR